MNLQELVEQDFGIEGRGKWYHAFEHDSLVVNAEDQTWFWNSKGLRGDIVDYLVLIRGMDKADARNFLENSYGAFKEDSGEVRQNKPYERLVDIMWENGQRNRDYWYRRCLKDSTIDSYKLGHYNGWNLVPIYDNGEFINFQMRRDEPKKAITQWYRTGRPMPLFNAGILPFTKKIYITEGTVDAILLNQMGLPAVSPNGTNTWQEEWFPKFSNINEIYYVEDNDQAGRHGSRLVANSLGIGRVKIVSFNGKEEKYDSVNFFQDGGTKESYLEWIENNSKYLFELEVIYGRTKDLGKSRTQLAWKK